MTTCITYRVRSIYPLYLASLLCAMVIDCLKKGPDRFFATLDVPQTITSLFLVQVRRWSFEQNRGCTCVSDVVLA